LFSASYLSIEKDLGHLLLRRAELLWRTRDTEQRVILTKEIKTSLLLYIRPCLSLWLPSSALLCVCVSFLFLLLFLHFPSIHKRRERTFVWKTSRATSWGDLNFGLITRSEQQHSTRHTQEGDIRGAVGGSQLGPSSAPAVSLHTSLRHPKLKSKLPTEYFRPYTHHLCIPTLEYL
jgi:hypothetical protein